MKILFVENRQQTLFWEQVARRLSPAHEIAWLVQNHGFTPSFGSIHRIPYPRSAVDARNGKQHVALERIAASDRNINYFGGSDAHYGAYDTAIGRVLQAFQPDVIFGESTLFHELLTIAHARRLGTPYLNPTSCRYPTGRFSFYQYDTMEPWGGSGESLDVAAALQIAQSIGARRVAPDYMKPMHRSAGRRMEELLDRARIMAFYLAGERFNTPSPWRKLRLDRNLLANKERWEKMSAQRPLPAAGFKLLYPLQMQPESTIDVWGFPHRDQVDLLTALLRLTDENTSVLVKPNPKSYYELDDAMVAMVEAHPRLVPVSHVLTMADVLPLADLVLTVTGTVAIEAVCAGVPVCTMAPSLVNAVPSCPLMKSVDAISAVIASMQGSSFPRATDADKAELLSKLHATSYPGIISNPFSTPSCVDPKNLEQVAGAFSHVLDLLASAPFADGGAGRARVHASGGIHGTTEHALNQRP